MQANRLVKALWTATILSYELGRHNDAKALFLMTGNHMGIDVGGSPMAASQPVDPGRPVDKYIYSPTELTPEEYDAMTTSSAEGGGKIQAIKLHRSRTGFGLKESKDFIESEAKRRGIEFRNW